MLTDHRPLSYLVITCSRGKLYGVGGSGEGLVRVFDVGTFDNHLAVVHE